MFESFSSHSVINCHLIQILNNVGRGRLELETVIFGKCTHVHWTLYTNSTFTHQIKWCNHCTSAILFWFLQTGYEEQLHFVIEIQAFNDVTCGWELTLLLYILKKKPTTKPIQCLFVFIWMHFYMVNIAMKIWFILNNGRIDILSTLAQKSAWRRLHLLIEHSTVIEMPVWNFISGKRLTFWNVHHLQFSYGHVC